METDINIRKINLVKKVLELKDEFFLEKIEKLLSKSKVSESVERISHKDYADKINEAEKDFENNNFFSSKELLKELDL